MDSWWNNMPSGGRPQRMIQEDPLETQSRKDADFFKVEALLVERLTMAGASSVGKVLMLPDVLMSSLFSFLGRQNPFIRTVQADQNRVWVLDNTAWQSGDQSKWVVEFTTCFFRRGRADVTKAVSAIVDAIGLDGKAGVTPESRALIADRIKPFIDAPAPSRQIPVVVEAEGRKGARYTLGPSNANGIATQGIDIDPDKSSNDKILKVLPDSEVHDLPEFESVTRLFGAQGFGIISDIDDTIKITQTPSPIGILRTTFAEPAQFTSHMPDFYKVLQEQLGSSPWFYVSASPYNLYPFLRQFINQYYPPGQILLRDGSWQTLGGLLGSLTQGVKAYKEFQINKINSWFPKRKFICIGDSTQMDPETYASIYKQHPGWISAIYIRKVLDAPFMETKNQPERFEKAFDGVPKSVWRVFVLPDELKDHLMHITSQHEVEVCSALKDYSCGEQRNVQQLQQDQVKMPER